MPHVALGTRVLGAMLALAAIVLSSGCGSGSAGPGATTQPPRRPAPSHSASASASPSPADPGLQIRGADLDGDGQADRVKVGWLRRSAQPPYSGTVQISVHLATGTTQRIVVGIRGWIDLQSSAAPSVPATAAAQLDGVPGEELIVDFWNTSASFRGYRVIADHDDRLVALPAPGRDGPDGWKVGATVGTGGQTYACPAGRVMKIVAEPMHDAMPTRTVKTTYVWRGGGWQQVARQRTLGGGVPGNWACGPLADWAG